MAGADRGALDRSLAAGGLSLRQLSHLVKSVFVSAGHADTGLAGDADSRGGGGGPEDGHRALHPAHAAVRDAVLALLPDVYSVYAWTGGNEGAG